MRGSVPGSLRQVLMAPETPVGLRLPDGGLTVSGQACAALSGALRAQIVATRVQGGLVHPAVLELARLADAAAAEHERRRSAGGVPTSAWGGPAHPDPRFSGYEISTADAGALLGIGAEQARRLCTSGDLVARKWGREWRVSRASVEDYRKTRRKHGYPELRSGGDDA